MEEEQNEKDEQKSRVKRAPSYQNLSLLLSGPAQKKSRQAGSDSSSPFIKKRSLSSPEGYRLRTKSQRATSPGTPILSRQNTPDCEWMDARALTLFKKVSVGFAERMMDADPVAVVAVLHMVPSSLELLMGLRDLPNVKVLGVIFKSSIRHKKTIQQVKKLGFKELSNYSKARLNKNPKKARGLFRHLKGKEKLLIIDIGGYFARSLPYLSQSPEKMYGIVEDTANGHEKYKQVMATSSVPVMSVARSRLKGRCEDARVGESIVHTADKALRKHMYQCLMDHRYIVVIGYGPIGKSIAHHLREKKVQNVIVYDTDPIKLAEALADGFVVIGNKSKIFDEKYSIIFCATGNKSLCANDLGGLQAKNTFIFSCTSRDDEFDIPDVLKYRLPREFEEDKIAYKQYLEKGKFAAYRAFVFADKSVYLMNEGNAINFSGQSVMGPGIRIVQASLIVALQKLVCDPPADTSILHPLSDFVERDISMRYVEVFANLEFSVMSNLTEKKDELLPRDGDIQRIRDALTKDAYRHSNRLLLLLGASGEGKKEVIREYARRFMRDYKLIYEIDCSFDMYEAVKNLAIELGVTPVGKSYWVLMNEIGHRLVSITDFMLIFYNVKYAEELSPIVNRVKNLEYGRRHIVFLATEAIGDVAKLGCQESSIKTCELKGISLTPTFTASVIKQYPFIGSNDNVELIHEAFAGRAVCMVHCMRYIEYVKNLSLLGHLSSKMSPDKNYRKVFAFMAQDLSQKNDFRLRVLFLVSMLFGPLSKDLLQRLSVTAGANLLAELDDLCYAGFIEFDVTTRTYSMHDLIRQTLHETCPQYMKACSSVVITMLEDYFKYDYYAKSPSFSYHLNCALQLHCFERFLLLLINKKVNLVSCVTLFERVGSFYLHERRNYITSRFWYMHAFELEPTCQSVSHGLAVDILFSAEKTERNGKLLEQVDKLLSVPASAMDVKVSGILAAIKEADAAITRAYVLKYRAHQLSESSQQNAEVLLREALGILKSSAECINSFSTSKGFKEQSHRTTGFIHHVAGGLYVELGQLNEAKAEYIKAMKDRGRVLGSKHLDYARTLQKLAKVLYLQQDYENAKAICDQAYHIQIAVFVDEHPNLVDTVALLQKIDNKIHAIDQSVPSDSLEPMSDTMLGM